EPADILSQYEWLFRDVWVDESADEIAEDDLDLHSREKRISKLRVDALKQIGSIRGFDGIFGLAEKGKAASRIGWHMVADVLGESEIIDFLLQALLPGSESGALARQDLIAGALGALRDVQE